MYFLIKKYIRNLSNKNSYIENIYSFLNSLKMRSTSNMSDEFFAKMKYKENNGKDLNLEKPKYFNKKLWWLKIKNRNLLMIQYGTTQQFSSEKVDLEVASWLNIK